MARIISVRNPVLLFRKGLVVRQGDLEAAVITAPGASIGFGALVSKTVLRRAVDRNRWRRIVKEIVRKNAVLFPCGYWCAVRLKRSTAQPLTYHNQEAAIVKILQEAFRKVPTSS